MKNTYVQICTCFESYVHKLLQEYYHTKITLFSELITIAMTRLYKMYWKLFFCYESKIKIYESKNKFYSYVLFTLI